MQPNAGKRKARSVAAFAEAGIIAGERCWQVIGGCPCITAVTDCKFMQKAADFVPAGAAGAWTIWDALRWSWKSAVLWRYRSHRVSRTPVPVDAAREAKRAKVVREFWGTERSYIGGLDLVHDHFLTPIIASLDSPRPLLTREELTTIFSTFIDIGNFHRRRSVPASESESEPAAPPPTPPLTFPLLLSIPPSYLRSPIPFHFSLIHLVPLPYSYARKSAKLKLTDWLLIIVQRCPRLDPPPSPLAFPYLYTPFITAFSKFHFLSRPSS
ncbi:hypothetical protein AZE42_08952 [Rhizopogon vesiculosus]|uniref:DH domain-containing protein n=1 Tax=Rhizopogon vesiculosus TaxID=180088 RepID=A0A1J8QJG0_9AGAM|nr:hypothetical protein AZE42_08952 [Rhizopogon vesiculosus]